MASPILLSPSVRLDRICYPSLGTGTGMAKLVLDCTIPQKDICFSRTPTQLALLILSSPMAWLAGNCCPSLVIGMAMAKIVLDYTITQKAVGFSRMPIRTAPPIRLLPLVLQ